MYSIILLLLGSLREEQVNDIVGMQEHIKRQPMSAREAQEIREEIKEKHESLRKMNQLKDESMERVNELQMLHNRCVLQIDESCHELNIHLCELNTCLPSSNFLLPLDYNSSKRADPSVLAKLVKRNKEIKVCVVMLILVGVVMVILVGVFMILLVGVVMVLLLVSVGMLLLVGVFMVILVGVFMLIFVVVVVGWSSVAC